MTLSNSSKSYMRTFNVHFEDVWNFSLYIQQMDPYKYFIPLSMIHTLHALFISCCIMNTQYILTADNEHWKQTNHGSTDDTPLIKFLPSPASLPAYPGSFVYFPDFPSSAQLSKLLRPGPTACDPAPALTITPRRYLRLSSGWDTARYRRLRHPHHAHIIFVTPHCPIISNCHHEGVSQHSHWPGRRPDWEQLLGALLSRARHRP